MSDELDGVDTDALRALLPVLKELIDTYDAMDFEGLEEQILAVLDSYEYIQQRLQPISGEIGSSIDQLNDAASDLEALKAETNKLKRQGVDTTSLEGLVDAASQKLSDATGSLSQAVSDIDELKTDYDIEALRQSIQELHTLMERLKEFGFILEQLESISDFDEVVQQIDDLKAAVAALSEGASQLEKGIELYTSGVADLDEGAKGLKAGADRLGAGGNELNQGYGMLSQGIETLLNSYKVFDEQGIRRLSQLANEDLSDVFTQMLRLKDIDAHPQSFSGAAKGTAVDVKYLIETAGV